MSSKIIFSSIALVVVLSFSTNSFNKSIEERIIDYAISNDSITEIDLNIMTPFKWDSMYVFHEYDDKEYISQFLSFEYNSSNVPDRKNRMIFVKGKSVVYEEDFGGSASKTSHIYMFMPIDTTSYSLEKKAYTKLKYSISSQQAKFHVERNKSKRGCSNCFYFYLSPVIDLGKKSITAG